MNPILMHFVQDDMSSEVGARLQCVVDECSPYQARQKDMDEHTLVNLLCRLLDIVMYSNN